LKQTGIDPGPNSVQGPGSGQDTLNRVLAGEAEFPQKNLATVTKFFISFDLMSLDAPDELHLRNACAYIELGLFDEAQAEMEQIDPSSRLLPELLASRIPLYRFLEKWDLIAIVARKLVEWNPEEPGNFVDWGDAICRTESIHAAHAILKRAASLHPTDPTIQFNLAGYEVQMGSLDRARTHLK